MFNRNERVVNSEFSEHSEHSEHSELLKRSEHSKHSKLSELSEFSEIVNGYSVVDNSLKSQEYKAILDTLKQEKGCRKTTAEKLAISSRTLRYKLAKMKVFGFKVPSSKRKVSGGA